MDRTERLLDLIALFLDAREPIAWAELREVFPDDYSTGSDEACERKFERDKAELLELGIPLAYIQGDDDRKDGYLVERDAYYLPEAGLTPEEVAVLYAAGSAALGSGAFPGQQDLAHALRKIGFLAGRELPTPHLKLELGARANGSDLTAKLEQLWAAASGKKWVELSYFSPRKNEVTERRVDPYGLALRRGIWSLVGHCHLRRGVRTFHVHRIRTLKVNSAKPRSPDFEVPAEFRMEEFVASHPWEHRFHSPLEVTLLLRGALAPLASRAFPGAVVQPSEGGVEVRLQVRYLDGLIRYALSLGPECRLTAPLQAVERGREMATSVLEKHRRRA
jgi:proteasome accessory factor B